MAYEEMSREEAGGIFFRSPSQPQAMPMEAAPMAPQPAGQKPTPVKASKSSSAKIETPSLVEDVATSAKQMQQQGPKPEMISPIDTLVDELISNWKPLAIGAGAVVGGELLRRSIQRKAADSSKPPAERIDPTFNPPDNPPPPPPAVTPEVAEPKPLSPMEILQQRKEQMKAGGMGVQPPAPPAGPTYNVPTADVPAIPPAVNAAQGAGPVQPPVASQAPAPAAPSITEAVAIGESPVKSIQTNVAEMIDGTPSPEVSAQPEATTAPKRGRPAGAKNLTAEAREMQEAAKGINMYRNMFGFQQKNPNSPQSLAAIEATNRFISEAFQGQVPGSRDPFLNPSTDVTAAGKKFYSGVPEGYRNKYIPWLEQNLNTLPPETQSYVLSSMTKGQTKDLTKIVKGLGLTGAALGAYETAFAKTPQERAMAGANMMGAILPPGMDIGEAGAPGVSREAFSQAALLGSPFAQTEWAKTQRLREKAGAGRGIAPPSQYQR